MNVILLSLACILFTLISLYWTCYWVDKQPQQKDNFLLKLQQDSHTHTKEAEEGISFFWKGDSLSVASPTSWVSAYELFCSEFKLKNENLQIGSEMHYEDNCSQHF